MNQVSTPPLGDLAVRELSTSLLGCRMTVCAGGGIAATELPRIARELRRHGASVNFVVTETALKFIGLAALEWASGAPVVVNPTGLSEHIFDGDALLVAPATADVLAKAANGLCTDGVTTLLQSAFGQGRPVFFLPTMHESMARSPFVLKNVDSLSKLHSVYFLEPRREEGKLKAPDPKRIVLEISHRWNALRLFNGRAPQVALTYGGTRAAIDPVRCITNLSSGRLGVGLAEALYRRGVSLVLLQAQTQIPAPQFEQAELYDVPEFSQLKGALEELNGRTTSGIFHIAAVSDFLPLQQSEGKISSDAHDLSISLVRAPKLLSLSNLRDIPFQAACKLTSGTRQDGLETARKFLLTHALDVCLWNHAEAFKQTADGHDAVLLVRLSRVEPKGNEPEIREIPLRGKHAIAEALADAYIQRTRNGGLS